MTTTPSAALQTVVRVAVVECPCGMIELDQAMHRTSRQAWQVAAAHVENSRGACANRVRTFWDDVPAALAAGLPAAPAAAPSAAFVVA